MARFKTMVLMAVTAAMMAGCGAAAPQYLDYLGHRIPTTKLSAPQDIAAKMAQDGVVSMEAFGALSAGKAAGAANAAALQVEASSVETIRLDPNDSALIVSVRKDGVDPNRMPDAFRKSYFKALSQVNAVSAALSFSKPLEISHVLKGRHDYFTNHLGTEASRKRLKEKLAMCQWEGTAIPVKKEGNGAFYYADMQNYAITLSEFAFQIKYSDKEKALPDMDPCSAGEADKLLRQLIALIAGGEK